MDLRLSDRVANDEHDAQWQLFQQFDFNLDGWISEDELGAMLEHLDPILWKKDGFNVKRLWKFADANNDGRMEFSEFVKWAFQLDPHSVSVSKTKLSMYFQTALKKIGDDTKVEAAAAAAAREAAASDQRYSVEDIAKFAAEAAKAAGGSTELVTKLAALAAAREARARYLSARDVMLYAKAAAVAAGASPSEVALAAAAVAAMLAKADGKNAQQIAIAAAKAAKDAGCTAADAAMIAGTVVADAAKADGKSEEEVMQAAQEAMTKANVPGALDARVDSRPPASLGGGQGDHGEIHREVWRDSYVVERRYDGEQDLQKINRDRCAYVWKEFGQFDANHDGVIQIEELKAMLKHLDDKWTDYEISRLFRYVDADDGGSVSYDEFLEWCFMANDVNDKKKTGFMGRLNKSLAPVIEDHKVFE